MGWNMEAITLTHILAGLRAVIILGLGMLLASAAARLAERLVAPHRDRQFAMLVRKAVFWGLGSLVVISTLHNLGFNLSVLLGAAGILTVALGFASQTSASNLISGLFLLSEKPFAVGDMITIGDVTGEVMSIDALSVKLRTFDNIFIRIPNESIIRDRVRTNTRFPIRRFDLKFTVRFQEDLRALEKLLRTVAEHNAVALQEPKPSMILLGFEEWGVGVQFSVWAARENFFALRNSFQIEIQQAMLAAGIEIAYRRLVVSDFAVAGGSLPEPPASTELHAEKVSDPASSISHGQIRP